MENAVPDSKDQNSLPQLPNSQANTGDQRLPHRPVQSTDCEGTNYTAVHVCYTGWGFPPCCLETQTKKGLNIPAVLLSKYTNNKDDIYKLKCILY